MTQPFQPARSCRRPFAGLVLALVAVFAPTRDAQAQAARNLTNEAADKDASPWAGSVFTYDSAFNAYGLRKDAQPTWDPYYAQTFLLMPQYHPNLPFFLRGRFSFSQELTDGDTKYLRELVWSDLQLEAVGGVTEPNSKIRINATLRAVAPLSKASRAQSLLLSLSPALSFVRTFKVREGLILGYNLRYNQNFNQYTTTQYDAPTIGCGDADSPACSAFLHTGVRNAHWSFSHGPLVVFMPWEPIALSFSGALFRSRLYDLTPVTVKTDTGDLTFAEGNGVDARYAFLTSFDITWSINPTFSLSGGAYSFGSQLGPDGQYRSNYFANRLTALYLDVNVDVERLVATVRGRP